MRGLHDNADATGLENFRNGLRNLLSEAFLDLKSAGEHLGDSVELGSINDVAIGNVTDMHLRWMVSGMRRDNKYDVGTYLLPCQ